MAKPPPEGLDVDDHHADADEVVEGVRCRGVTRASSLLGRQLSRVCLGTDPGYFTQEISQRLVRRLLSIANLCSVDFCS